jgi:hypothetical protein
MPKKTPQSGAPEAEQSETKQPDQDAPSSTSSQRTHLADDVSNLPTGEAEQSGPVTYHADHVPEDAPVLLSSRPETKVVSAPETETPKPAGADAETA